MRDWIDQAVDGLLERVLKAFAGGGETAVAAAEGAPAPAPGNALTAPLAVDVAEGPDHTLSFVTRGSNATAMLASDPLPVPMWLDNLRRARARG